jgi:hypothetical protein
MTTSQAQWLTLWFTAAITLTVLGYDLLVIRAYGPDASISRVVGRLLERYPSALLALVFWLGLLVGHCWLRAD